jgi:hypothetical protein
MPDRHHGRRILPPARIERANLPAPAIRAVSVAGVSVNSTDLTPKTFGSPVNSGRMRWERRRSAPPGRSNPRVRSFCRRKRQFQAVGEREDTGRSGRSRTGTWRLETRRLGRRDRATRGLREWPVRPWPGKCRTALASGRRQLREGPPAYTQSIQKIHQFYPADLWYSKCAVESSILQIFQMTSIY